MLIDLFTILIISFSSKYYQKLIGTKISRTIGNGYRRTLVESLKKNSKDANVVSETHWYN